MKLLPFPAVGICMKKLLLIAVLALTPLSALAEDRVIQLEGNAKVITDGNGGRYVYRGYDTDELIKRRLLGYDDKFYYRNNYNRVPSNDYSTICGGADRASERRRCREDLRDLDKDRAELYRKYNN
jgi:hypothetical protein